MFSIFIYFICSVINVILNTLKSLILARYNNKMLNCGINAITWGFYTIILKQIADTNLITAVVVTILTNIIGVYVSLDILTKIETATKLYKISITLKDAQIENILNKYQLEYAINKVKYKSKTFYNIEIYAKGKTEKNIIKEIITDYEIHNYNICELKMDF